VLFNSFHYVLFFLVVLLVLDFVRRREPQYLFLIGASYYFYWAFSSIYVLLVGNLDAGRLLLLGAPFTELRTSAGSAVPFLLPHREPALPARDCSATSSTRNFAIESVKAALGALGIENRSSPPRHHAASRDLFLHVHVAQLHARHLLPARLRAGRLAPDVRALPGILSSPGCGSDIAGGGFPAAATPLDRG